MRLGIIYFLIIILANTIGAISGMGGGVIIKPALDFMGESPLSAINFYSSFAVLVMSIVSTVKQVRSGISIKIQWVTLLAIGSILGGKLGDITFRYLLALFSTYIVNLIQIGLTLITLIWALTHTNVREGPSKGSFLMYITVGLCLGWLATLLGIGGGPINVALLIVCFNMKLKSATVYSITIIFFSQLSKLVSAIPHITEDRVQYLILPFILIAAIIGGLLGAMLNKKFSEKTILKLYRVVVLAVIGLNIINGVRIVI